jgi:hypothetical protein
MTIELEQQDFQQMSDAGTAFITIAEPAPYDRDDVPHPSGIPIDLDDVEQYVRRVQAEGQKFPLAANLGRFVMIGSCGNLKNFAGWEICSIYPERPNTCRKLEMGGGPCRLIRQDKGVDPPGIELLRAVQITSSQLLRRQ